MPQIIYSLISQFLVIPHFLLLWHFMHALNFSVKTLPFCISNPFASLVVLPAKNIPNDLLFLCNSWSWIATHCHNSFMYSGHAHKSQNKLNLTPFTEKWLVLPPLCGESRSVQLLSCVQHVWAKETDADQSLSNLRTQQQWENGDTHVRLRALLTPETVQSTSSYAPVASCVLTEFLAGAPWGMDLPQKVSPRQISVGYQESTAWNHM